MSGSGTGCSKNGNLLLRRSLLSSRRQYSFRAVLSAIARISVRIGIKLIGWLGLVSCRWVYPFAFHYHIIAIIALMKIGVKWFCMFYYCGLNEPTFRAFDYFKVFHFWLCLGVNFLVFSKSKCNIATIYLPFKYFNSSFSSCYKVFHCLLLCWISIFFF